MLHVDFGATSFFVRVRPNKLLYDRGLRTDRQEGRQADIASVLSATRLCCDVASWGEKLFLLRIGISSSSRRSVPAISLSSFFLFFWRRPVVFSLQPMLQRACFWEMSLYARGIVETQGASLTL